MQGILRYNENKRCNGLAVLLGSSGMLPGADQLSVDQLAKQFKTFTDLNSRTKTNAVHISLNFSPKDQLSTAKMAEIGEQYLEMIGFGNQPYLIYQHMDAGHPHLHLVTTNIDRSGKRIETHLIGKTKSEEARKSLEMIHGLVPAEGQEFIGANLKQLQEVAYGKQPTRSGLGAVINHVLANYHFASFAEFNAVLELFHVTAYRGEKDSLRFKRRGLVFHFLDKNGQRIGVPVKASSFYNKPTLDRLEKRYPRSFGKKKEKKEQVVEVVLKVLTKQNLNEPSALEVFRNSLLKNGIGSRFVINDAGRLYGVTFIDHRSGCVFKGSDLGKELSANNLAHRFGLNGMTGKKQIISKSSHEIKYGIEVSNRNWGNKSESAILSGLSKTSISNLGDISDSPYQGVVFPNKKRKKKRKSGTDSLKGNGDR